MSGHDDTLRRALEADPYQYMRKEALAALDVFLAEKQRYRDALEDILSTVENANVPYERLQIGALARAALDGT